MQEVDVSIVIATHLFVFGVGSKSFQMKTVRVSVTNTEPFEADVIRRTLQTPVIVRFLQFPSSESLLYGRLGYGHCLVATMTESLRASFVVVNGDCWRILLYSVFSFAISQRDGEIRSLTAKISSTSLSSSIEGPRSIS